MGSGTQNVVGALDFQEVAPTLPPTGTTRMARVGGQIIIAADGGGFQALGIADWKDYWQAALAAKTGALPQRWTCSSFTDFVGTFDYQVATGGGTNTDAAGTDAPGVRIGTCTGATGAAFVNYQSPAGVACIPEVRLGRWAAVFRFKLPTATPDANTRITFGIAIVSSGANYGFGSFGAISTTVLTSVAGGSAVSFPAGSALSTKAADPNNYVWGYVYNDLTNVRANVDNEASDFIVTPTSSITAGLSGFLKIGNQPAGGVRVEAVQPDFMAAFCER